MTETIAIPSVQSDHLLLKGISHGFFGRRGGVSEGVHATLNCALGSQDARPSVLANRALVAQSIGAAPERLITLKQIHSPTCHIIAGEEDFDTVYYSEGDAMVTKLPGIALGILTADCPPVLFADPASGVIGAAHAGWKGAFTGVLLSTIVAMESLGASRHNIRASIGPCIAQSSYEVDDAFRQRFLDQKPTNAQFFTPGKPGHHQFDLKGYNRHQLQTSGIRQIDILPDDTYADEQGYFSFRRTTHRNEPDYGRQLSVIMRQG
ncbi:peptidoglycan editing factor PgeF [bacterium]|nr:peptidoglycan editing factor PgeF [bacterium]